MRFLKSLLLVLGGLLVSVAVIVTVKSYFVDLYSLWRVANANRSAEFNDPRVWVLVSSAAALVGGLLLGIGIALPSATFKARYANKKKQESVASATLDGFNGASTAPRPSK